MEPPTFALQETHAITGLQHDEETAQLVSALEQTRRLRRPTRAFLLVVMLLGTVSLAANVFQYSAAEPEYGLASRMSLYRGRRGRLNRPAWGDR